MRSRIAVACLFFASSASAYYPGSQPASYNATPANPTGTSSTGAYVMMGLAGSITPVASGRINVTICGDAYDATLADGGTIQIRLGTGAAPSNAGASAGTTYGSTVTFKAGTVASRTPFCLNAIVTGLTVGTAYWIDVAMQANAAAVFSIENVNIAAMEF